MLRFEVSFIGKTFSVNWVKGKLMGDYVVVAILEDASKKFGGITHEGYTLPDNPLEDYESVLVLADICFDEVTYASKSLNSKEGELY